ncbi:hypothetical protein HNY73_014138 [Argiope bruennichi]|uniref:Spidroin C-terminal domain-containing protein n=2 Tax=Argiope bruennichi TaxID=94029 RepID=A0A8T0ET94_ARGBR|nr:hypothetical protein HNY73_014138 [Argiope bruennichi]
MNLILSFVVFIALLLIVFPILGAGITDVSSDVHEAQTLLQISDKFLYCFGIQSSEKFPLPGQIYTETLSSVIRSFASQSDGSLSEAEAILFQTSLATSIADNVAVAESQPNNHPPIFPVVLQLISDCFTEITGYPPSNLIRRIETFLPLLLEVTSYEWDSFGTENQGFPSEVRSLGDYVNQTQSKTSLENYKTESTNEIDLPPYDSGPRQTSQSFVENKSLLIVNNSSINDFFSNKEVNKRTEPDQFLNGGKQFFIENDDSFEVNKFENDFGTLQHELKVNQEKYPSVISPAFGNYNYPNFSITSEFSIAFSNALKSSDYISEAFETSLHPILASKAYYKAVYDATLGIKNLNPVSIARIFSMAIKQTFNELTAEQHIMSYGNVVGKYLNSRNLLTPENIMMFSSSYVNFIKSALDSLRISHSKEANIEAIIHGLMNFLVYLKDFDTEDLLDLTTDFADNVFTFTGIRRKIFNSVSPVCDDLIFNQIISNDSNFKSSVGKNYVGVVSKSHIIKNYMQGGILHNSFISKNSKNCSLPSVISFFTYTFSETISLSETLSNAFERRLFGIFLSRDLFSIMYDYFRKLGIDDFSSRHVSGIVSQAVNTSYYAMTPVVITNTISNVIGHKLLDENILLLKNFEHLSDSYVNYLETSFRLYDSNHTSRSVIRLILEGTENFLSSQKTYLADNVEILATYFVRALNSSIKASRDETFSRWPQWDDVSTASDFDFFDQIGDNYIPELNSTTIFSEYILNEIWFYPYLLKLFKLPQITSTSDETFYDHFLNSLFSDGTDNSQPLVDLIKHEIVKNSASPDKFTFAKLFVESLEKFLIARYVLKPENAILMARAFVRAMNDALRRNWDSDYDLKILINTTERFLAKYLIFGLDNTESWSSMFLSELSSHPNFLLSRSINEIAPEILTASGILSTESSTRVNNLASTVRTDILSLNEVNITKFSYNLVFGALQINNDFPKLKSESALTQALLEGVEALIGVINGAYITALDVCDYQNEVIEMCKAILSFLNL